MSGEKCVAVNRAIILHFGKCVKEDYDYEYDCGDNGTVCVCTTSPGVQIQRIHRHSRVMAMGGQTTREWKANKKQCAK